MEGIGDKRIAEYLKSVIADYQEDHNMTRMMRRLRIKTIHLRRRFE